MPHIEKEFKLQFAHPDTIKDPLEKQKKEEKNKEPVIRQHFKPLIVVLSPRNIQEVKDALAELPYMKLWIKYHIAPQAYPLMQKEFLKNPAFSHLIIIPDDLVVTKDKLDILIQDTKNLPDTHFDNSVVCGYCNIDVLDMKQMSNISHYLPPLERSKRPTYHEYKLLSLEEIRNFPIPPENPKILGEQLDNLFRVKWAGFPCMIIPRKIMENIVLRNDSPSGVDESGCCFDVMFARDMHKLDYDIFVDKRVEFKHLRSSHEAITSFHLKDKDKHVYWDNGESKQNNKNKDIESWKDDDYGF